MPMDNEHFEVSDWTYFFSNWPTYEEVNEGWHKFWGNTELIRTYRDSKGRIPPRQVWQPAGHTIHEVETDATRSNGF